MDKLEKDRDHSLMLRLKQRLKRSKHVFMESSPVRQARWLCLRFWLNCLIFRRYLNRQILINAIFCTPDRYLAIFCSGLAIWGLLASLLGVDITGIFTLHLLEDDYSASVLQKIFAIVLLLLYLLLVTLISVFVTRRAPEEFVQLLSTGTPTDFVLKALAFEAWIITTRLENAQDYKRVQTAIRRSRVNFELVRLLKFHVADRFHISSRIFSDHFLRFSASILRNRMLKRASNQSFFDLSSKKNNYQLNDEEAIYLKQQIKAIERYSGITVLHLESIIGSSINFSSLEDIFKNRSGTAALISFTTYLRNNKPKSRQDYELLYSLQTAYNNGFIWKRLISCCLSNLYFCQTKKADKKERFKSRLSFLLDVQSEGRKVPNIDNNALELWSTEMNDFIRDQRKPILNKVKSNLLSLCSESEQGKVHLLLVDYSRTVRYVMKKLLESNELSNNIDYFFWLPDDDNMAFGSRLLQHQLFQESESNGKLKYLHTYSGSLDLFKSRLNNGDTVVVLMGCDGVSNESDNPGVFSTLNNQFQKDLDMSRENKAIKTHFYALMPEYKNNLPSLIDRIHSLNESSLNAEESSYYESVEIPLNEFVEELLPCASFGYLWRNVDVIRDQEL